MDLSSDKTFNAYIDGFNLYKGALYKNDHSKWLDLVAFCEARMPGQSLGEIYYFTALVKERFKGDDAPRRQHTYLRVLRHQGIHVVEGKFRRDMKWLRVAAPFRKGLVEPVLPSHFGLTTLAITKSRVAAEPDLPKAHVFDMEEKGSDVNLASYLLRDVMQNSLRSALVVTGDSDLATPIQFATEFGCSTTVVIPSSSQPAVELEGSASNCLRLRAHWVAEAQLPEIYITPKGGTIHIPTSWKKTP
jgi:uncharacterized LabA/DUF88 family protein